MKYVVIKAFCLCTGFISLSFFFNIHARQYGSENNVSIQPKAIFPAIDNDNEMIGFGWFKNGFILEDSTTSCTFNSVFPVSGEIALNGGKIYLNSDLYLENITTLTDLGQIHGNGHILAIDSSIAEFVNSKSNTKFKDLDISLHSDLLVSSTIYIDGNCTLNGKNRTVELAPNIEIIICKDSTLTVKNILLLGLNRYNVRCIDPSGTIIMNNTHCILDGDSTFTQGSLQVINAVDFSGSYTYCFDSNKSLTIHSNSRFYLLDGINVNFRTNQNSENQEIIYFQDQSSEIYVENSSVNFGESGILLKKGTIIFDGKVNVDSQGTTTSNGIIFGNGIKEDDILVKFYPAARVNFNNTYLTYNLSDPNKFQSTSSFSKVTRGPLSCFYIKKNMNFNDITINVEPTSTILVDPDTLVGYNNCTLNMPTTKYSITGARFNTYTSILDGNDEIFLNEGILPLYTVIQNSNNYIRGNGGISGVITLYNSNAELNFDFNGQILNNVQLNGGTVNLSQDLELVHEKIFLGNGTINISSNNLEFGIKDTTWTGTIYWDGNAGSLELNSNTYLYGTWTFSGNCAINGNWNTLMLGSGAEILIERGSTLNLKNLNICKVKNNNIQCLDNAGQIGLNNTALLLHSNYNFEKGKISFENATQIIGSGKTFAYKTNQISNLHDRAILYIGEGTTFSYDPSSNARNLINLGCPSTQIKMDGATLHSTATGLQLTKGILDVKGKCYISSDASIKSEGIIFGDGLSSDNDLKVKINPESSLILTSGYVIHKNLG